MLERSLAELHRLASSEFSRSDLDRLRKSLESVCTPTCMPVSIPVSFAAVRGCTARSGGSSGPRSQTVPTPCGPRHTESVLGATAQEFESPILRTVTRRPTRSPAADPAQARCAGPPTGRPGHRTHLPPAAARSGGTLTPTPPLRRPTWDFAWPLFRHGAGCRGGLLSRQQRMKSWMTGLVSASGGQATPTWLGLTPVTGR